MISLGIGVLVGGGDRIDVGLARTKESTLLATTYTTSPLTIYSTYRYRR